MKRVYLDNAATTYVSNEVLTEMLPVFNHTYGNSSSLHTFGRESVALLDKARDRVSFHNVKQITIQGNADFKQNLGIYMVVMSQFGD